MSVRRRWTTAVAAGVVAATLMAGTGSIPPAGADATSDRCYLAALHQVFLDRPATAYDLEAWTQRYAPAPARPGVPRALARSEEWLTAVVTAVYDAALDRAPDPDGLAFWVEQLRGGARVATLTARVYGSDEVWERGGSTPEGFVADVFPRIMGRSPSADDVTYWAGEVAVRGRGGVARALVGSLENRRTRVTTLYDQILGRAPDTAGRDFWVARLASTDDVELAVQLASSSEAYDLTQVGCDVPPAPTSTTIVSGNRSSRTPHISADGRYVAFLSRATDLVPDDDQDVVDDLFLLDRSTGTITKVTDGPQPARRIAMSDDGRHVAYVMNVEEGDTFRSDIYSWDRVTGTTTQVTDGDVGSTNPVVSADGSHIAFESRATNLLPEPEPGLFDTDVFTWDRATGTIQQISDPAAEAHGPALSPDGSLVAYVSDVDDPGSTIYVWRRSDGSRSRAGEGDEALDVADDGDVLLQNGTGLRLWDSTTQERTTIARRHSTLSRADITPDGASVAFQSSEALVPSDPDDLTPDVHVWERATGTIVRLSRPGTSGHQPSTSADGRFVAYRADSLSHPGAADTIVLWDRGS